MEDAPPPAAIAETHTSLLVFVGDRAYKLKKPVDLGFLDFTTREAREQACHAEVALNRRLAPDAYLGVADVHGPDGEVCDHLVVMRRMPEARRLATLVQQDAPGLEDEIHRLARLLADFHSRAQRGAHIDAAATPAAVLANWEESFEQLTPFMGSVLDPTADARLAGLVRRYLAGRRDLLEHRIADRRICDGHGDLQAADIFCLDEGPQVLDCIEFTERFRHGDGAADVAFLAMDLERLGAPELAELLLATYAEYADDRCPASLMDHYVAYRAHVRCKVACLRAAQLEGAARTGAEDEARTLHALALRHLERAHVHLVLVGGLPGAGKSTLAAALGERLDWVVLRSDEVRKELAGIDVRQHDDAAFGEGLYAAASTAEVYEAMRARAGVLLRQGVSVVLDASWTDDAQRAAARALGDAGAATVVELRCTAPDDVAEERLVRRLAAGADASDATPDIRRAMAAGASPWPESTEVACHPEVEAATVAALRAIDDCRARDLGSLLG